MTGLQIGVAVAAAAVLGAAGAGALRKGEPTRAPVASAEEVLFVSAPAAGSEAAPGRVPPGSRIAAVPLDGEGPPRVLTGAFAAAAAPSVSPDGSAFLFAGREREEDRDAIFEMKADGSGARRLAGVAGGDCGSPSRLPDGRVLFTAPAPGFRGRRAAAGRALFAAAADGTNLQRLTFFPEGADADPTILADGRVLFVRGGATLLAVHSDGTGIHAFHGPGLPAAARVRPREAQDRSVWFVEGGRPFRIDARRPGRAAAPAAAPEGTVRAVEPLPGGDLLLSIRPAAGRGTFGLFLLRGGSLRPVPVLDDPDRDEVDPVLLAPRPRPQGHLSIVKAEKDRGRIYAVDARRTGRGPAEPRPAAVRIYEALPSSDPGPADDGEERLLGEVPLEGDGSFYAEVPADRPLRTEAVDAGGRVVLGSGFAFWVRPNEVRACIGCHEDPAVAPPNAFPEAVRRGPVDLARRGGEGRAR